jgi:hypothetical protein
MSESFFSDAECGDSCGSDELLQVLDDANAACRKRAFQTGGCRSISTNIYGSAGRRNGLFISHKLSNNEQSTDVVVAKRRVKDAIAKLGVGYLDIISIHSPLTDLERRIGTYRALLELCDAGFVRNVWVYVTMASARWRRYITSLEWTFWGMSTSGISRPSISSNSVRSTHIATWCGIAN